MYAICSRPENNKCKNLKITKNIAAGGAYAGFVVPASNCGDYTKFRDNVAHSIDGFKGGAGGVIFPDPSEPDQIPTCYEASYFTAYKCTQQGIIGFKTAKRILYHHITTFDNFYGTGSNIEKP